MKDYKYYKKQAEDLLVEFHGDTAQLVQAYKDIHTITNSIIMIDVMNMFENHYKESGNKKEVVEKTASTKTTKK